MTQEEILVTHINHLGEFTVMPDEPWNCVTQSKLHPMASQPIGIARLFLSIPATSGEGAERLTSPPHPPSWPTEGGRGTRGKWMVTWRKGVSTQFYRDSYRRQMWTSRIVHETWQHWPYKPSRQETAVLVVYWCSVTRCLLWGSLKQLSLPLSGFLHEKHSKIESCSVELQWRRPFGLVTH